MIEIKKAYFPAKPTAMDNLRKTIQENNALNALAHRIRVAVLAALKFSKK